MTNLKIAMMVEFKKYIRSKVFYLSFLAMLMIPFMGGFFMFILKDPETAKELGFISTKADLLTGGTASWESYFNLLQQAISLGGIFIFGFVTSFVFGREYSDGTIKDLLALPTSRKDIVNGKFMIIIISSLIQSLLILIVSLLIGKFLNLPNYSLDIVTEGSLIYITCSLLTIFLSTPIAFFASMGKGYLSPLSFLVLIIILAQIITVIGYGQYFPWAIPSLISGASGEIKVTITSYLLVLITSLLGVFSTTTWWKYADH